MIRQLEFASHPGNLSCMRQFVREFMSGTSFADAETDLMVLGIDEACTNIIRHAYDEQDCHLITLSCEALESGVRFRLRDFGRQHDPGAIIARPIEAVQPGGLGLHLIRRAFDEVDYNLEKDGTELVLTKRQP
jgi:serine/threonine-protein kinase RsbW